MNSVPACALYKHLGLGRNMLTITCIIWQKCSLLFESVRAGLALTQGIAGDCRMLTLFSYVGADLLSLCREAAMRAVSRIFDITDGGTEISKCGYTVIFLNIIWWLDVIDEMYWYIFIRS